MSGLNKLPALDEIDGDDKDMTEEEWTLRVAELNKFQVGAMHDIMFCIVCEWAEPNAWLFAFILTGNCGGDESDHQGCLREDGGEKDKMSPDL